MVLCSLLQLLCIGNDERCKPAGSGWAHGALLRSHAGSLREGLGTCSTVLLVNTDTGCWVVQLTSCQSCTVEKEGTATLLLLLLDVVVSRLPVPAIDSAAALSPEAVAAAAAAPPPPALLETLPLLHSSQ